VGVAAEFRDEIIVCTDCGTSLADGGPPQTEELRPEPEGSLVTVGRFREPQLAHLAKTKLESEGINAFVRDEYTVGVNWLLSNAIGGVKVKVSEEDEQRAIEIIESDHSSDLLRADDELGCLDTEDCCPRCGSQAVLLQKGSRKAGAFSLLFGLPLIFFRKRYKCEDCGFSWKPEST
jgi:predicted RNA-binding Zn-ribbon protein involved in translation (DUF1610 family)